MPTSTAVRDRPDLGFTPGDGRALETANCLAKSLTTRGVVVERFRGIGSGHEEFPDRAVQTFVVAFRPITYYPELLEIFRANRPRIHLCCVTPEEAANFEGSTDLSLVQVRRDGIWIFRVARVEMLHDFEVQNDGHGASEEIGTGQVFWSNPAKIVWFYLPAASKRRYAKECCRKAIAAMKIKARQEGRSMTAKDVAKVCFNQFVGDFCRHFSTDFDTEETDADAVHGLSASYDRGEVMKELLNEAADQTSG